MRISLFILVAGIIFISCSKEEASLPNVILIMVDDLGSGDLGCYGSSDILTPNIDRLADQGLKFTQAYSGNTVCAPARSTLMTGQHSGHVEVRGNTGGISLPADTYTMADMFKSAGYATGGFGKWGLGAEGSVGTPEKQGFDTFYGYYHQIHAHDYYTNYLLENGNRVSLKGQRDDVDSYTAYSIFEKTKEFIAANKEIPFFCFAAWTVPHGEYIIPKSDEAVNIYASKDWTEKRKNYAAMVTMLDRHVGAIVEQLEDLGISENTLLVFCSDNGGGDREFAEYKTNGELRGFKRDLYEGGLRVPMIASWPGQIPGGTTIDMPVYFPDLFPTFREVCQAATEVPQKLDGASFLPWLLDPAKEIEHRRLYWEYPHFDWSSRTYPENGMKQAFRYKNWKMVRNGPDQDWEFYDLSLDPAETDNVAYYHPGKMQQFQNWIEKNRTEMVEQVEAGFERK